LQFLPRSAVPEATPYAAVGGSDDPRAQLVLSNWSGAATPPDLLADTCTEIVLRLLASSRRQSYLGELQVATAGPFDAGMLLAVWALLHRDTALELAEPLVAAARAAEFGVATHADASAFVCTVNAYCDPIASPLTGAIRGLGEQDRSGMLYDALLPQVEAMLRRIRDFDLLWVGEFSDILQSEALRNSGAVQVEAVPLLHLMILDTPLRLHPLVKLGIEPRRSRILTVRSENTYTLEYRYESWVQLQSWRPAPRIDLGPLAARLNMFERRSGRWRAEPVQEPVPRLFLDNGAGGPAPSSIDRETLVAEACDFLRLHAADPQLLWSPYPGSA